MEIQPLRLSEIDESPSNPRKHFDPERLNELAASIKEKGVQQAIKVRPKGKRFEIIFGSRRFRATKIAGLPTIPAHVEDLADDEVRELQLTENAQREDVHPLDEADAYRELHEKHGRTVDQLAARVGKSKSHVYARLKLCDLGEPGRKAYWEGKIDAGIALLLARIPGEELQVKALEEVLEDEYSGSPMPYAEAASHIRDSYMLVLAKASFAIADATLVPAAGACSTCPKRTGNQKELFADVGKVDLCTDPPCFKTKTEAAWERVAAEAKKAGGRVLSAKESKKVFPYGDGVSMTSGYAALDDKNEEDKKRRTFAACLGKGAKDLPVVIGRDNAGAARQLVDTKELAKALRAAGATVPWQLRPRPSSSSTGAGGASYKPDPDAQKKHEEKQRQGAEYRAAVRMALIEKAAKDGSSPAFWSTMAAGALAAAGWETRNIIAKRRECAGIPALEKLVAGLHERECALFVLEVLLTQGSLYSHTDKLPPLLAEAAAEFGIDVKKVRAPLIAAAAERRKEKK